MGDSGSSAVMDRRYNRANEVPCSWVSVSADVQELRLVESAQIHGRFRVTGGHRPPLQSTNILARLLQLDRNLRGIELAQPSGWIEVEH